MTLSVAILISMVISLTTTPMMCATILRHRGAEEHQGIFKRIAQWVDDRILSFYEWTLAIVLRHPLITIVIVFVTVALTALLYVTAPTTLFPQQDTGRMGGAIKADQDTSYQAIGKMVTEFATIVSSDPAVRGWSSSWRHWRRNRQHRPHVRHPQTSQGPPERLRG